MHYESACFDQEKKFKTSLLTARDYLGTLLATSWSHLTPDHLTYATVVKNLLAADRTITEGKHQDTIRDCFTWREISFPTDSMAFQTWDMNACALEETEPEIIGRRPKQPRKKKSKK